MALTERQWQTIEKRSGVPRKVMQVLLNRGERSAQSSVSPMGAYGRAQLMPATARALERKYRISTKGEYGNVLGGALYLGEQKRAFGNWRLAFAAYNAGGGAVRKYGGVPPFKETRDYVKRTMAALTGAGGAASPPALPGGSLPSGPDLRIPQLGAKSLLAMSAKGSDPMAIYGSLSKQIANLKPLPAMPGMAAPVTTLPGKTFKGSAPVELFYDPIGAIKNGQQIAPIGGHSDHVHYSAPNAKMMLRAIKLARGMGLRVSENPAAGDTVDPVHVTGSYHYRRYPGNKKVGEAIDVSGDPKKMAAFYRRLAGGR